MPNRHRSITTGYNHGSWLLPLTINCPGLKPPLESDIPGYDGRLQ